MYKLNRVSKSIRGAFLSLIVLAACFQSVCLAAKNDRSGTAFLSLRVRPGWVDLYVANQGPGNLDASYRISRSELGASIDFFFFTKEGICRSCKFSEEEDFVYSIPLAQRNQNIFPGEIVGLSFFSDEIAERYNLKSGCYAFFAKFTRRSGQKFASKNISNIETICIK
jgi:hypothetical protein